MGKRKGTYKMRKVVETVRRPFKSEPSLMRTWEVLDCGHEVPYYEPESTTAKIREVSLKISGEPQMRRCRKCAAPTKDTANV